MTFEQLQINKYTEVKDIEIIQWDDQSDFSNLEISLLNSIEKEIKDLCFDFDPYHPEIGLKKNLFLIKRYQLDTFLDNPFLFTNRLLRLMDKVEQAIKTKNLKQ